jgi:hypothetical protein
MDSVDRFADETARFEQWLIAGTDREADAVRECLIRLLELYRAGLSLPHDCSDEVEGRPDVERISDTEWQRAVEAARRLPFDFYGMVFDPTAMPPEDPVVGSIADDLADIYRDVVTGLRAHQQGDKAGAVWEWSFGLHSHWGAHATAAIFALHWWLRSNASNRLSAAEDESG